MINKNKKKINQVRKVLKKTEVTTTKKKNKKNRATEKHSQFTNRKN